MNRAWIGLIFSIAAGVGWIACVSDDPGAGSGGNDASTTGSESNPCYANGTCDPGLSCKSNVCVNLDSGAGTTDSGSGSDASTSDSGGGTFDAGCELDAGSIWSEVGSINCPDIDNVCAATDGGTGCCEIAGTGTGCPPSTCNTTTGAFIKCLLPAQCHDSFCAVTAVDPDGGFVDNACPRRATINKANCVTVLPTGGHGTCTVDADCTRIASSLVCRPYVITYNGDHDAAVTLGLCVAP